MRPAQVWDGEIGDGGGRMHGAWINYHGGAKEHAHHNGAPRAGGGVCL